MLIFFLFLDLLYLMQDKVRTNKSSRRKDYDNYYLLLRDTTGFLLADTNIESKAPEMYLGYKSQLIRCIGNLTYHNSTNQKIILDTGALPLVLNNTGIDEYNACKKYIQNSF